MRCLFGVLPLLFLAGCAGLPVNTEAPRVTLVDMQVTDMRLFEQRYALTLRVQNPNPFDLDVVGLDFRLSLNGESFADGVSNQPVRVPAYGEVVTEVEVSSSLLSIFEQFRRLSEGQAGALSYRIDGSVALGEGWMRLPFERAGTIGGPLRAPRHGDAGARAKNPGDRRNGAP